MIDKLNVVVIEDDRIYGQLLTGYLVNLSKRLYNRWMSFNVDTYLSGEEFFDNVKVTPHIVFLDYYLDGKDKEAQNGLQILRRLKRNYPDISVIALTSQDHTITTVELMKNGAIDYIQKDNNSFQRIDLIIDNIVLDRNKKTIRKKRKHFAMYIGVLVVFSIIAILNR